MFHLKRRDVLIIWLTLLVLFASNGAVAPVSAQPSYGASCSSFPLPPGCPDPPSDVTGGACAGGNCAIFMGGVTIGSGQLYVEDKNHAGKTELTDVDMPIFMIVVVPPGADRAFVAIMQYYPPSYALSNYLEVPWQPISGGGPKTFGGYYAGSSDPQGKYAFKALLWYHEAGVWKYAEPMSFIDFCQPLNPPMCTPEFPLPLLSVLLTLAIPMLVLRSRRKAAAP